MKIAILGCEHMHAESYVIEGRKLEALEIVAIAEQNRELGEGFAQRHGLRYFQDYKELLKEDITAVIICSANSRHAEMTIEAAKAKKHVIVEKPIATTIEDAEEMIKVCRENGVKLMVALPVRYAPPIERAKQIVDNGTIGEIVAISGTNHGTMPGGWFIQKELSGGGAVIDHTIHVADLMHWMLKCDIKEVYAKMGTKIHNIEVEDCGLIFMEFENGTYATLDTSWNRPEAFPTWGDVTMELVGTKGAITVDAFAQHGNLYSNNLKYSSYQDWGDDMNYLMLKDFAKCIKEDLPSPVTGEDGLFALKIALMAYESAEKNEPVRV
jgi:predicted dehydrogenase